MKKKEVAGTISLQIPANKANPAPPIGTALGPRGLNIMEFCKQFNERCKKEKFEDDDVVPVVITYYMDKSFTFETKMPPVPNLIKKELKIASGAKTPGTQTVGSITKAQIEKIAKAKMKDMNVSDFEAAVSMVKGTCVSMGVKVEN